MPFMTRSDPLTPEQAYARLADRCAVAEMSTGEALEKLRRLSVGRADAYRIVQRLVDERFIDDERFARSYVRDRLLHARWGLAKIRQSMRQKGIDDALIDEAVEAELDEHVYFGNLAAALRSKARSMASPLAYADKVKLARFAVGRGYEHELVLEMLADEDYWRRGDDEDGYAD